VTVGDVNKNTLAVLGLLLMAGLGFLWYSQMYKPAVAAKVAAVAESDKAAENLRALQAQLDAAKEGDGNGQTAAEKQALSKILIEQGTIPNKEEKEEGLIAIGRLARLSDVDISAVDIASNTEAGSITAVDPATGLPAEPGGASVATELTLHGSGAYPNILLFVHRLQDQVRVKGGKVYANGRLMDVSKLNIGEEDTSGEGLPSGHIAFSITVRIYSATANKADPNAQTPGTGTPTGDTSAAAGGNQSATTTGAQGTAESPAPAGTTGGTSTATTSTTAPTGTGT
jgi:hypothetical protein